MNITRGWWAGRKKWVVACCLRARRHASAIPNACVSNKPDRERSVQVRTHEKNESGWPGRRLLRPTHIVTSTFGSKHCGDCSRRSEGAEETKMTGRALPMPTPVGFRFVYPLGSGPVAVGATCSQLQETPSSTVLRVALNSAGAPNLPMQIEPLGRTSTPPSSRRAELFPEEVRLGVRDSRYVQSG